MASSINYLIHTDGGARGNPGPSAIGVEIKTENGAVIHEISRVIGIATNNEAEYLALISALEYLAKNSDKLELAGDTYFKFFADSSLLVNQVNGIFKVKNSRMREFILKVRQLEMLIPGKIFYNLIPREKNKEADYLVNKALDSL